MKKEFKAPELEIIYFNSDDIITESSFGERYGANGDDWEDPADI